MTNCIYRSIHAGLCVHPEMLQKTDSKLVPCILTSNSETTDKVVICKLEQGPKDTPT